VKVTTFDRCYWELKLYGLSQGDFKVNKHRDGMTTVLPTFSSYKSSLYHQRQKNYPELPETASDVNLEGK
jgi:hypothetical protein